MKSKYSSEVYEITKVKNNIVYIKNDKNQLYKIKKDEIKVVEKPTNNIILKEKVKVAKEHKVDRKLKKEDIQPDNIRQGTRERKKKVILDL